MYFCYLDESGTSEAKAQTSHFVLLGIAIPASAWHAKDGRIDQIKGRYGLKNAEIHTGYMARRFPEQEKIPDFEKLDEISRRHSVQNERNKELIRVAALKSPEKLKALKKLYAKTADFVHLSHAQRMQLLDELADEIGSWQDARLFADAVDKSKSAPGSDIFALAFEQLVTRFHTFLVAREGNRLKLDPSHTNVGAMNFGLLIEDNNPTVAKRLTELMRRFHTKGTLWTRIDRIIETPLFVDSSLTSMVQMADLCAYAARRFFENNETSLFDRILDRFDKSGGRLVGIRHYTGAKPCSCKVCLAHRKSESSHV